MSSEAMVWAKKTKTGAAARKTVLLLLADYADEAGECFPGQLTLAAQAELGERTVRRALADLEGLGLIRRVERRREDGYRTSDRIRLNLDASPATAAGSAETTSPANGDSLTGRKRPTSPATAAGLEPQERTTRGTASSPPTPPTLALVIADDDAPDFDAFWATYPRHVGKRTAATQYQQACRRASPAVILAGALRFRDDPNREDEFTAHPATWLRRDGWEDDPLPARSTSKHTAGGDGLRRAAQIARAGQGPPAAPQIVRRPPPALPTGDPRHA